jgi:hypothetical protein
VEHIGGHLRRRRVCASSTELGHWVAQEALDRGNPASRLTNGNKNASVLPLPVAASEHISAYESVGEGSCPRSGRCCGCRAGERIDERLAHAEVGDGLLNCHASKDVFSMVALRAATLVANECKVARLPVVDVDRARKSSPLCTGEM